MELENKNPNLLLNLYFQGFSQWRLSKGGHSLSHSGVLDTNLGLGVLCTTLIAVTVVCGGHTDPLKPGPAMACVLERKCRNIETSNVRQKHGGISAGGKWLVKLAASTKKWKDTAFILWCEGSLLYVSKPGREGQTPETKWTLKTSTGSPEFFPIFGYKVEAIKRVEVDSL